MFVFSYYGPIFSIYSDLKSSISIFVLSILFIYFDLGSYGEFLSELYFFSRSFEFTSKTMVL